MEIYYKNRKIKVPARKVSIYNMGLMFKTKNTENLLFDNLNKKFSLTSLFVFFSFLALWLDKNNKITALKIVKPFTLKISSGKPFSKIIEIPLNNKNKEIIDFLVGSQKDLNI
ncbi:hypothetical protein J4407_01965 [Candidatus Pacearchaeota archaeon]|nr:hypothetical protein [Candidatus Pacearchaeota archaeon]